MTSHSRSLPRSFYAGGDVVELSRRLLGKTLCSRTTDGLAAARIVETEAYCGRGDQACHAHNGRRTERTEVMYGPPGHAYVYLCYGIHHLFNVVTNREGLADAVLIRAVEPLTGADQMAGRRGFEPSDPRLTNGPGKLTQALSITVDQTREDLLGNRVWIEESSADPAPGQIASSARIGVDYAGKDALLPWRFYLKDSSWVSRV